MDFSKLITFVFGAIFIFILYFIIYYALKIMYKDVKGGGKKKKTTYSRKYGIEVLKTGENPNLEEGSILLLNGAITIGRKEGNNVVLAEPYVSGNHSKISIRDNEIIIEDLNSTNGVFVNEERVRGFCKLRANDRIRIGNAVFKVIRADKN